MYVKYPSNINNIKNEGTKNNLFLNINTFFLLNLLLLDKSI